MADVLVLCYHAVSPTWPSVLAISPDRLRSQLEWLVHRGYRGATFTDAVTGPPAARTLAVTFDDAYRSVRTLAFPIFSELGLPGSVYVPTAFAGDERPMRWPGIEEWHGGPHEHELACMRWEELAELADAGWEVGSHTRSHPRLTSLGDASLTTELEGSREEVEHRLGHPCASIAYPYGAVDDRVVGAAQAAGYRTGAALPERPHRSSSMAWPRVGVYPADAAWRFRVKASPTTRRLRTRLSRAPAPGAG